jgi:hypothetical protein
MLENIGRKVKVIGYQKLDEPRQVSFITFYNCNKCNDLYNCTSVAQCKFVKYITERLPKESVDYIHINNMPLLRLVLPTEQEQKRAQQIITRAQKLRTNRALITHTKGK